jgi:hypothetical protein
MANSTRSKVKSDSNDRSSQLRQINIQTTLAKMKLTPDQGINLRVLNTALRLI